MLSSPLTFLRHLFDFEKHLNEIFVCYVIFLRNSVNNLYHLTYYSFSFLSIFLDTLWMTYVTWHPNIILSFFLFSFFLDTLWATYITWHPNIILSFLILCGRLMSLGIQISFILFLGLLWTTYTTWHPSPFCFLHTVKYH